jgi:two-component system, LytTR family, response regulator LytT
MDVLIIEDELRAAQRLTELLAETDNSIRIVAILDSIEMAVKWFGENPSPDLIFSDIQLADGLCFDIYNRENLKIDSPIVFCTAYDEYLMHAFETNAVSYLLKPISKEQVEKALEKYQALKQLFNNKNQQKLIANLVNEVNKTQKCKSLLIINQGEKIIPLRTADIAYVQYDNHSVIINTMGNQHYHHSISLDLLEDQLDPQLFFRANRQFIINRNAILNAERYFNRKLVVKLHQPTSEKIIVSKLKSSEFMEWLEQ